MGHGTLGAGTKIVGTVPEFWAFGLKSQRQKLLGLAVPSHAHPWIFFLIRILFYIKNAFLRNLFRKLKRGSDFTKYVLPPFCNFKILQKLGNMQILKRACKIGRENVSMFCLLDIFSEGGWFDDKTSEVLCNAKYATSSICLICIKRSIQIEKFNQIHIFKF